MFSTLEGKFRISTRPYNILYVITHVKRKTSQELLIKCAYIAIKLAFGVLWEIKQRHWSIFKSSFNNVRFVVCLCFFFLCQVLGSPGSYSVARLFHVLSKHPVQFGTSIFGVYWLHHESVITPDTQCSTYLRRWWSQATEKQSKGDFKRNENTADIKQCGVSDLPNKEERSTTERPSPSAASASSSSLSSHSHIPNCKATPISAKALSNRSLFPHKALWALVFSVVT